MTYLHGGDILHCNIKAENVLVKTDGTVKVADPRLACHLDGVASRESYLVSL